MLESLQKEFHLSGKDGQKVIFKRPYFNDDKELTFLECEGLKSKGYKEIVFNEKLSVLEFRGLKNGKRMLIHLQNENDVFYQEANDAKSLFLQDILNYLDDLRTSKEKIVVYTMNSAEYPLFFTTETLPSRTVYSSLYTTGFLYCVNEQLKKEKQPAFESYDEMQRKLIYHFSNRLTSYFEKIEDKQETYYKISLPQLVQLYVQKELHKVS